MKRVITTTAMVVCAIRLAAAAEPIESVNAMYFGNSFLENSMPQFHTILGKGAGVDWKLQASIGPGWPIRLHVSSFEANKYTARARLFSDECDTVLIHHFVAAHKYVTPYYWDGPGRKWIIPPGDVGAVASAAHIIELHQSAHPDGRAVIYSSWPAVPGMRDFEKRVKDELMQSAQAHDENREESLKQIKERKLTFAEMEPILRAFDYQTEWLRPYPINGDFNEQVAASHTRAYYKVMMEELKERFPKMWKEGRLALIPNGEVMFALDQKMRAGEMPGVPCVGYYKRDGGHVRGGLPRYTLAATCFAVMFQRHPECLDYKIFNDKDNYRNENLRKMPDANPIYCHLPDVGTILEITPERKKLVDDTIWEVVTHHPYTGVPDK